MVERLPRWVAPFALIAFGQLGLWWAIYLLAGGARPHLSEVTLIVLQVCTAAAVAYLLFDIARMVVRREEAPFTSLVERIKANRYRLLGGSIGCLLWAVLISSVSGLKSAIPLVSPYWADPALASIDRHIFFTDPWRISHFLLGWATKPIDIIYALWHPVEIVTISVLLFAKESTRTNRAIVAYGLTWLILGGVGWLSSSVGPLFYDGFFGGNDFAPLIASLRAHHADLVLRTSGYLVDAYSTHRSGIGTGLSAMPSLHVAIALWVALVCRKWWAWTFFAMIWIGSVHLGWHYWTDGLVASIGAAGIWRLTNYPLMSWRLRPATVETDRSTSIETMPNCALVTPPLDNVSIAMPPSCVLVEPPLDNASRAT
jgi:hypothetical protein